MSFFTDITLSGGRRSLLAVAALAALASPLAMAQGKGEIRIAHVYSKTGPLEAYGKQTSTGFMMGLDYATGGTMTVAGKKLVVIEKDDQGKPDVGKSLLATAYGDDKADIAVGPTSSGVALALLPVAEEYKKILLVEPAVADAITGDKWNRYIFRTGRNSSQDAISNAIDDRRGRLVGRDAGAGLRVRPRRRQGVQGSAQEGEDRPRGVPAAGDHRLHRRHPAHRRRAQGQAGPQGHRIDLGRRGPPYGRSPRST